MEQQTVTVDGTAGWQRVALRRREYDICKKRGHVAASVITGYREQRYLCKYCGTEYWTEQREANVPS